MTKQTKSNGQAQEPVTSRSTVWSEINRRLSGFFSQLNSQDDLTTEQWEKLESKPRKAPLASNFRYRKWGH